MAWVAVDLNGNENIFDIKPFRHSLQYWDYNEILGVQIELPEGSIKKLIGRELTWNDEPIELKEE